MYSVRKGNYIVKIVEQNGSYFASLVYKDDLVVKSKFYKTLGGAKRAANHWLYQFCMNEVKNGNV